MYTAIDLFSGCGGLSLGLHQARVNGAPKISTIVAVDSWAAAAETYKLNLGITPRVARIDKNFVDALFAEIGPVDIVVGGPPCQGFSSSGKRALDDQRNSMVKTFLYAVETFRPKMFLMENVTGFTTMQSGAIFHETLERARALGYEVHAAVLLASAYGVPQRRRRFVMVGSRIGNFVFPRPKGLIRESSTPDLDFDIRPADLQIGSELSFLDATSDLPYLRPGGVGRKYKTEAQNAYQKKMRTGVSQLTEHFTPTHSKKILQLLRYIPEGGSALDPEVLERIPTEIRPGKGFANCYKRIRRNEPSPTITRNFTTPSSANCVHPTSTRALTLREGARCQSFPDKYRFTGTIDEKRLQIGNAVPPLLARAIGVELIRTLSGCTEK